MAGILNAEVAFPQFPALDQYGPNTTLLLHGDGTNGAQNNTFLDSSTNNFTITRNGNTTQGTFSPFSQPNGYWSNYFNGSSYLSAANNSAFNLNGVSFTVECWVYWNSTSGEQNIAEQFSAPSGPGWTLYKATTIAFYGGSSAVDSGITPVAGQWYHIAVSRNDSTGIASIYINGSRTASASFSVGSSSASSLFVGTRSGSANFLNGYVSNLRIVKGSYVYDPAQSTITVPTSPLTAVSGTSFLSCQSNRFVDNSTNAFAITTSGTPSVQSFHPISAPTAYYPAVNGGGGYFDGSGDYLTVPSNAALTLGTNVFTLEFWAYATNFSSAIRSWLSNRNGTETNRWGIDSGTSGTFYLYGNGGFVVTSSAIAPNQWLHICVTRANTSTNGVRLFINGKLEAVGTSATDFAADIVSIGAAPNGAQPSIGYITDTRIINGSIPTSYQTSSTTIGAQIFTPPSTPLTTTSQGATSSNVALLTNFTNAGIIDSVSQNQLETVGNAQVSTTQSKFGGASMYFDGASSVNGVSEYPYISGTGDFTAEFWVYPSSLASYNQILATTSSGGFGVLINSNGTISYTQVGVAVLGTSANSVASGVWSHVAVARSSGVIRIFVNGNQGYSGSDTTNFSAYPIKVGRDANASSPYTGYVDDLRITKGIARYTQNFTPPQNAFPDYGPLTNIPTVDPNFKNTTLLLHGNGTNGAQNNTFLDSSTNNFTITRNGNTTQGTFTPFSQPNGWWSNYLDGSSYLSVPDNSALQWGTGDFCVEFWMNPTFVTGSYREIICKGTNNTGTFDLALSDGGRISFFTNATVFFGTIPIVANQWVHVALTRSGTTLRCFVNGSLDTTVTSFSYDFNNTGTFYVGVFGNASSNKLAGYISNLRCVKGSAVYTSNFTPSTLPLTSITNTSLLTCQSNYFKDNSTNAFTVSPSGTPTVQNFYPFFPPLDYSTVAIGGSAYFDGSGDYLSSSVGAIGTGNFTVEFYANWTSTFGGYFQISTTSGGLSTTYSNGLLAYSNSGTLFFFIGNTPYGTTYTIIPNQWVHIAIVRSSGTVSLYVNGILSSTPTTDTTNISGTYLALGGYYSTSYLMTGYLSNFRVLIGTALYTSNFTPPTAPLTAITNTSFLLSATNGGIFDNASKNDLETVGNAQISTTQSKFGGSSMYFNGTTDYLKLPNNPALGMGSGDFTIEAWIYPTTVSPTYQGIFSTTGTSSSDIQVQLNNNLLRFTSYTAQIAITTSTISANQWTHIAVCRFGGTTYLYINGNLGGSGTDSTNWVANPANIGAIFNSSYPFSGYIDDFRITNGYARYRYNFTPPAAQFPNK